MKHKNAFRKVVMANQPEIAKVNRKTGVLYLNQNIWQGLPTDQKEFVLLHEAGHLNLKTADEFAANKYAVSKFSPVGELTKDELGQRIVVMREILDKADNGFYNPESETSPFAWGAVIGGAVNGIFSNLSVLGVGSKARQQEADAAIKFETEKSKQQQKTVMIAGIILTVITTLILTLRKK